MPRHLRRREWSRAPHALAERLAVDVGHHEIDEGLLRLDEMNRNDVGMRELGSRARFPEKSLAEILLHGERLGQQLDRHGAIERDVAGEKHHGHAAAPDLALKRESAGERFLELEEFWRRRLPHAGKYAFPGWIGDNRAKRTTNPSRGRLTRRGLEWYYSATTPELACPTMWEASESTSRSRTPRRQVAASSSATCSWTLAPNCHGFQPRSSSRSGFNDGKSGISARQTARYSLDGPGSAWIYAGGTSATDDVVFGEPKDLVLLGARSLEGLNLRIDPVAKTLVDAGPAPAAAGV